jgi:FtsP/CotA-like multicopper oxidase with cupredoxin domain
MTLRDRMRWLELRREVNGSGLSRRDVARMGLLVAGGALLGANGRPLRAQSIIPEQDFPPSPPTRPFAQPLITRRPAPPESLIPPVNLSAAARRRAWKFERRNGQWAINGELFDVEEDHSPRRLQDPRNRVQRNSNEVWRLVNGSGGWEHPVHVHLEEAQAFRVNGVPVPDARRFRSDIHHLWDNASEVEIMMSFRDFPDPDFTAPAPGERGRYVLHCHNTTHEDHAMMQTFNVLP